MWIVDSRWNEEEKMKKSGVLRRHCAPATGVEEELPKRRRDCLGNGKGEKEVSREKAQEAQKEEGLSERLEIGDWVRFFR